VEKAGLTVGVKNKAALIFLRAFLEKSDESPVLKTSFEALSSAPQRQYHLYLINRLIRSENKES
jgi:uncharacterized protein YdeI (YjbR/CyaY-like superfamily)